MKKLVSVLVVLFVSCFVYAGIEGVGFSKEFFMEGLNISLGAENRDAHTETWIDKYSGEKYTYFYPASASGFLSVYTFWNIVPFKPRLEIFRWNNKGDLSINFNLPFIYTESVKDFKDINFSSSFNFKGLEFNTNLCVWDKFRYDEEGLLYQDIFSSGNFWFKNAVVTNTNLSVNDFSFFDWDSNLQREGFVVEGVFYISLLGNSQISTANSVFAIVPEPSSIMLLGAGLLLLTKKRN